MKTNWLGSLSQKAQGFLIATLLFRSKDSEALFSLFAPEDAQDLSFLAEQIMQLQRSERVRLLVKEMKKQQLAASQPWILAVHPSWVAEILRKEHSCVQHLALSSLPTGLKTQVSQLLDLNDTKQEYPVALLYIARQRIEKQLVPMRMCQILLELTKEELAYVVSLSDVKALAFFLANEPKSVQKQIAQRLEFTMGQALIDSIETQVFSDVDFVSIMVQAAKEGKIDNKFATYLKEE